MTGRRLIDWVLNGASTHKGQFVPTAAEGTGSGGYDGQRDTMHNTLRYAKTM